jgi:hypothetical protein
VFIPAVETPLHTLRSFHFREDLLALVRLPLCPPVCLYVFLLYSLKIDSMPRTQRTQRTTGSKEKKLNDRIAKLAQDAQRNDGTSITDTDLQTWVAPPVSWSYTNMLLIATTRFRDFIRLVGADDPRGKIDDIQMFQWTPSFPTSHRLPRTALTFRCGI